MQEFIDRYIEPARRQLDAAFRVKAILKEDLIAIQLITPEMENAFGGPIPDEIPKWFNAWLRPWGLVASVEKDFMGKPHLLLLTRPKTPGA